MVYVLQYTHVIGDKYFSRWRLPNGSQVIRSMTAGAYAALGERGAGPPDNSSGNPQAVWIDSWSEWEFDTPSGHFDPGYVTDAFGNVSLNLAPYKMGVAFERVSGDIHIPSTLVFQQEDLPSGVVSIINGVATVI